jgi:hypothetical protein
LKKNVIQVVGHTRVNSIFESVKATSKNAGGRYYLNDAIDSWGYLTHEGGTFTPKEIEVDTLWR